MALLTDKQVENSKVLMEQKAARMEERRDVYNLLSDMTRLKIIALLGEHEELCPTDLTNILNISMSAVSHQLRLLEMVDLMDKTKHGKTICYQLTEKGREVLEEITESTT